MDAALTSITTAAPLGVGGVLLFVLVLLVRRETQDRADYRTQIAELSARHAEELKRINASHTDELTELRKEIAGLRTQLDAVNTKLDAERDRRRAAEDSAMGQRGRRQQGAPPWPE